VSALRVEERNIHLDERFGTCQASVGLLTAVHLIMSTIHRTTNDAILCHDRTNGGACVQPIRRHSGSD
jgi:hypothetical protein